jgi:hypothetical protein
MLEDGTTRRRFVAIKDPAVIEFGSAVPADVSDIEDNSTVIQNGLFESGKKTKTTLLR